MKSILQITFIEASQKHCLSAERRSNFKSIEEIEDRPENMKNFSVNVNYFNQFFRFFDISLLHRN